MYDPYISLRAGDKRHVWRGRHISCLPRSLPLPLKPSSSPPPSGASISSSLEAVRRTRPRTLSPRPCLTYPVPPAAALRQVIDSDDETGNTLSLLYLPLPPAAALGQVVPVINPDGVARGHYRADTQARAALTPPARHPPPCARVTPPPCAGARIAAPCAAGLARARVWCGRPRCRVSPEHVHEGGTCIPRAAGSARTMAAMTRPALWGGVRSREEAVSMPP